MIFAVMPAQAGIQELRENLSRDLWIPAFAGMTVSLHGP
jgi:hypothetical protein